ncbi:hypothetical protein [Mixta gaviniae]|uniref:hypothetical protein n=1 Tax=Mixta gaviniae TaxID=665914 RepID=UPI0011B03225|nr:hypothetical protein [Mixta gaviniae]
MLAFSLLFIAMLALSPFIAMLAFSLLFIVRLVFPRPFTARRVSFIPFAAIAVCLHPSYVRRPQRRFFALFNFHSG